MMNHPELLIVGAGPYGLATAALAQKEGLSWKMIGEPMGFWKQHMPKGMILRSPIEWHLDPVGGYSLKDYMHSQGLQESSVKSISLEMFLNYAAWFQEQLGLTIDEGRVQALNVRDGAIEALLENGEQVNAQHVVIAPGVRFFPNVPQEIVRNLPATRYSHTCDCVNFAAFTKKKCVLVGGRQSAFEWAALLRQQVDAEIDLVYRHETPDFVESDWSWVPQYVDATIEDPGWYRRQTEEERASMQQRFWAEGRKKLEPWLAPVLQDSDVHCWPSSRIVECVVGKNDQIELALEDGTLLHADHLILATGYHVDVSRVPYLAAGNVMKDMHVVDGFPALDESFQSSMPHVYCAGVLATRDFGPFFGFVVGCRPAARIIIDHIKEFSRQD